MESTSRYARALSLVALAALAACASGQSSQGGALTPAGSNALRVTAARLPFAKAQPAHRAGGWLSPAAKSGQHVIYVSDFLANVVQIYPASGSNPAPIGQITDGISGPMGSFVDSHGDLFTSNVTNYTVTMYPKGSLNWTLRYTGLEYPTSVTVGKDGTVYIADISGNKVFEYLKGSTRPKRIINVTTPQGVALDAENNLYVSYNTGQHGGGPGAVNEYAPHSTSGTTLPAQISWAAGDAIDGSGNLVVADQSTAQVEIFAPGASSPTRVITQGLQDPFRIAFDKTFKHLYVADPEANALFVYDYATGTLTNTITNGLTSVYGVALFPEKS
jgi:hypothetical protein